MCQKAEGKKVQQLSSKYKSIPIECTDNTEKKRKNFSGRKVENCLYLFMIMMIDDSTTLQEEETQNSIMDRLENELSLTYLPAVSQL